MSRDSGHHFQDQKVKGQGHQAALVGCTGMPTWIYSNGDPSICVHDVYHVITCRPGQGHIMAAARLQLVTAAFKCVDEPISTVELSSFSATLQHF